MMVRENVYRSGDRPCNVSTACLPNYMYMGIRHQTRKTNYNKIERIIIPAVGNKYALITATLSPRGLGPLS